jgi:hypothetical protein
MELIYPTIAAKYTGNIRRVLSKTVPFAVRIYSGAIKFNKNVATYDEAFELLKAKNIEFGLTIRNIIEKYEDHVVVKCANDLSFTCDIIDIPLVQAHCWCVISDYAVATIDKKNVRFHNLTTGHIPDGDMTVDHINRITTDNRRENLRITSKKTQSINRNTLKTNKSGIAGVCYMEKQKVWQATWRTATGQKRAKTFSSNKYGDEVAKQMAITYRENIIASLPHYIEALN